MAITTNSLPLGPIEGSYGTANRDSNGNAVYSTGGMANALNVTTVGVVKASAGRLCKVAVIGAGSSSGSFSLYDSATTSGSTSSNLLYTAAFGSTNWFAGSILSFDFPFVNGLSIGAIPVGSTVVVTLN